MDQAVERTGTDPWTEVIERLIELTQQRKIQWSPAPKPQQGYGEVEGAFATEYLDRELRLYKYRVQVQRTATNLGNIILGNRATVADVVHALELRHPATGGVWRVPKNDLIRDLYNAIQYQMAGVKEFLDDFYKSPAR